MVKFHSKAKKTCLLKFQLTSLCKLLYVLKNMCFIILLFLKEEGNYINFILLVALK